jgi:hypothetical protein
MRALLCSAAILMGVWATPAGACGHCVEDKVAAVYDHAVATKAFGQKHQVAFFGIDGALATDDGTRRAIESLARDVPGVDQGSLRVSVETAALSAAFDPQRTSFAQLQRMLERRLAPKKLTLLPMRVMDGPAQIKVVAK